MYVFLKEDDFEVVRVKLIPLLRNYYFCSALAQNILMYLFIFNTICTCRAVPLVKVTQPNEVLLQHTEWTKTRSLKPLCC